MENTGKKESDLQLLMKRIRKINMDNQWDVWHQSDITMDLPPMMNDEYQNYINLKENGMINRDQERVLNELELIRTWKLNKLGAKVGLIHSEVSELLEWYRQINKTGVIVNDKIMSEEKYLLKFGKFNKEQIEGFKNLEGGQMLYDICSHLERVDSPEDVIEKIKEEMADIIIRVLDIWGAYDDDPMTYIQKKLDKNAKRGAKHGGKVI